MSPASASVADAVIPTDAPDTFSGTSLGELLMSHPPGPQRAFAVERFSFTDVYKSWRPELEGSEPVIPLAQIDDEISSLFT